MGQAFIYLRSGKSDICIEKDFNREIGYRSLIVKRQGKRRKTNRRRETEQGIHCIYSVDLKSKLVCPEHGYPV